VVDVEAIYLDLKNYNPFCAREDRWVVYMVQHTLYLWQDRKISSEQVVALLELTITQEDDGSWKDDSSDSSWDDS
jgi:hypothetical protein